MYSLMRPHRDGRGDTNDTLAHSDPVSSSERPISAPAERKVTRQLPRQKGDGGGPILLECLLVRRWRDWAAALLVLPSRSAPTGGVAAGGPADRLSKAEELGGEP